MEEREPKRKRGALFFLFVIIFLVAVAANYFSIAGLTSAEYVEFVEESMEHRGYYATVAIREDFEELARNLIKPSSVRLSRTENSETGGK